MTQTGRAAVLPAQFPTDVTTFVGRRSERAQTRELLSQSRLVTLTGFGGVGKTRLAIRVASDLRRAFSDGAVFVPLASVDDGSWLNEQVADALGLQGRTQRTAPTSVIDFLQPRHLLLVLDNCEHLIEDVAVFADALLRTCPRIRVLATSREPLRIDGETVHQVPPLPVPEGATGAQATDAVLLFADRASSVVPGFSVDAQNIQVVSAVCRKLEGIPLAIELAAGRLRAMTPDELNDALAEHWDLLTRGSRAAPSRHQTMSACIDWSFDRCTPEEQQLWAVLAVFADGFELDAAVAVAKNDSTADCLSSLVDKSIVTATQVDGVTRYRLLPPLRQRGLVSLREQGKLHEVRRLHRDWCVDLARRAEEDWISPRQPTWIDRLNREAANLRLALEFCVLDERESEPGVRMGSHLLGYGIASGLFRQGRTWFDLLLEHVSGSPETRSTALRTACWWAAMQGDVVRAAELLEEEQLLLPMLDGHRQALHTQTRALVAMFSGQFVEATELFTQAINDLTQYGDVAQQVMSFCLLALNCTFTGDLDGALEAHEACLAVCEPAGDYYYRSYSLWIAGLAVEARGDFAQARSLQREAIRLRTRIYEPLGMGLSYEAFAWLAADKDPRRAATLIGAAETMWERSETSTRELPGLNAYHDDCLAHLVRVLGQQAFDEAVAAGRALSRDEAIAFALEEPMSHHAVREAGTSAKPTVLTKRETEIAHLVSEGLSNQQIADKLVISRRTAETHVEHILTKLGFTNRNQITVWLLET